MIEKIERNRKLVLTRKYSDPVSYRKLGKEYGISHTMVHRIVKRDWDKYRPSFFRRLLNRLIK